MLILSCEWELYTNLLVLCMKNHSCVQQELLVNNYLNQVSGVENVLALHRNSNHIILHIVFLCVSLLKSKVIGCVWWTTQ